MRHLTSVWLVVGALAVAGCAGAPVAPPDTAGPDVSRPGTASAGSPPAPAAGSPSAARQAEAAAAAAAGRPTGPSLPEALRAAAAAAPASREPAPDYRLAPRDQIQVQVHGHDDLTRTIRVGESGTITLPLVGELSVSGRTAPEAERLVADGLKDGFLLNPRVTVTVTEYQGRQVLVIGAVNQPGAFPLKSNDTSLLAALSEARGIKEDADRVAYVLRAQPVDGEAQPLTVDLESLLRTGHAAGVRVQAGDTVYVPEANTFYVAGEVEKRGVYVLRRDTTLSKALTEAGGVTKRAATGDITIVRTLPSGEKQRIENLDLARVMRGEPGGDVRLLAQDVVIVPSHGGKVAGYAALDVLRGLFSIGIPIVP
jgi:polysaccharide export outer membrane protein